MTLVPVLSLQEATGKIPQGLTYGEWLIPD